MVFKKLKSLGKVKKPPEEYIEVDVEGVERIEGKIGIRIENLSEFVDTDRILKSIRGGDVVFLKIKSLREKDIGELQRAVEKLKKTVLAQNGDIVGVEQDWLVLTPEHAAVHRE